ncbi:hypothetical protein GCM10009754_85560 [Amycolatopsis minnesotensis]|uniref:Uncharacterized protein n=1 Tax=Amycolatopsis minnesotensis TaxID=337894 RepID=A0ABN2SVE4_9PSEU
MDSEEVEARVVRAAVALFLVSQHFFLESIRAGATGRQVVDLPDV